MSWRLDNRRRWILLGLAAGALLLQALLDYTRAPVRQRDYELKLEAAEQAHAAFVALRQHRLQQGSHLDLVNDPAGTGLIGPEFSPITNARGSLEAKLTSLNPNLAALLVRFFREAGLGAGDPVAVAVSGSFPGANIAVFAALETMELEPVVITSVGASMWGANDPAFTWLDMESYLVEKGIFTTRSDLASFGGGNDMGRGLSPNGRSLIREATERNSVPLLEVDNIEDAIAQRQKFFMERSDRPYRLYVNVGGGVASIGSSHNKVVIPHGLTFEVNLTNLPRKGNLHLFAERGIPIVHLLNITTLARQHGLPVNPDYLPAPGEGEIFIRTNYRVFLSAAVLVVYCVLCVMILAPELRRGLFDRFPRRRNGVGVAAPLLALAVIGTLLGSGAGSAAAASSWLSTQPERGPGDVCLVLGGTEFAYHRLAGDEATVASVHGPRRVKITTRYLFPAASDVSRRYTLVVHLDDVEVLRKGIRAVARDDAARCDDAGAVSELRRAYVDVPTGRHELQVTATDAESGLVVARIFRETQRKVDHTVGFAPDSYTAVNSLQFASGNQSTYYCFDSTTPLGFTVSGPTTVKIYARLDFDHTMNGSQDYALEVLCDGEPWRRFHFHTEKLSSAVYVERPDILPGDRKSIRIPVQSGEHRYEVRCLRPENCGVAARIRIPRSAVGGR